MRHGYFALAFGLTACSTSSGPEIPTYFLDAGFEIGMAQTVADVCSSVSFREEAVAARQQAVADQVIADGHTADDVVEWRASEEYKQWADARTLSYFNEKGVDPSVNLGEAGDDTCRIAEEEIAAGSGIGQLLEKV